MDTPRQIGTGARILLAITAIVCALIGLALLVGGVWLAALGGSW